ncbi:MAG: hypothetical protein R3Y06_04470 [Faecalibacterium sp.]
MKIERLEYLPLGMVQFSLVIEKSSLANRMAAMALEDAVALCSTKSKADSKEDRWAQAINECILSEFPPIFESVIAKEHLIPVADPNFELLSEDLTQDLQLVALLQTLPPLTLNTYIGFCETVVERIPRELQRALYINQNYGAQARANAGDEKAMEELHQKVEQELIVKNHPLAVQLAERKLVNQLGLQVTGDLPKDLLKDHYYKEKQRFSVQMQSQKLNFDVYLEQRGLSVEEFHAEMHQISEQKLRTELGLLMVAEKENLQPSTAQLQEAFDAWLATKPKEKTFEVNDRQKIYRKLCQEHAAAFVLAHSTLIGR